MSEQPSVARVPQFDLADRLRKSLRINGLEIQDIADRFEVSRNTVSRWINGNSVPKTYVLKQWALWMNVDADWLISGQVQGAGPTPGGEGIADVSQLPKSKALSTRNKWDTTGVVDLFPALGRTA